MLVPLENQQFNDGSYFSGGELGFDFSDDFSIQSDVIFSVVSTSSASTDGTVYEVFDEQDKHSRVSKATHKRVSKFMRKKAAPYPPKLTLRPKLTATGMKTAQPNMSRRTRDAMLYAFPSFDRCDSLLFFPSTLAKFMNSGDIPAVVKLFESHFDKNCTICGNTPNTRLDIPALTQKMELMEQLQPDRITCIRHTQVDENTIKAVGYTKFTKSRVIYEGAIRMLQRQQKQQPSSSSPTCPGHSYSMQSCWKEHTTTLLNSDIHCEEEKKRYLALVERECDLIVYSRMDMELVLDGRTKKVKQYSVRITLTSMEEAKHDNSIEE